MTGVPSLACTLSSGCTTLDGEGRKDSGLWLRKSFHPRDHNLGGSQAGCSGAVDGSKSHLDKNQWYSWVAESAEEKRAARNYCQPSIFPCLQKASYFTSLSVQIQKIMNMDSSIKYISSEHFNPERMKQALGPKHSRIDLAPRPCSKRQTANVSEIKQHLQNWLSKDLQNYAPLNKQ